MDETPVFQIPSLSAGAKMAVVAYLWTKELHSIDCSTSKPILVNPSHLDEKISFLPIPPTLKPIIRSFVPHLVQYLNLWLQLWRASLQAEKESFNKFLAKLNLAKNLRVTLLGTVDGRATAREILKSEALDDKDAFRLACVNCMYDEVMSIWPRVQSYFVDRVYNGNTADECSEVQVFTRYAHEANKDISNRNLGAQCFGWLDCADAWYEFAVRGAVNSGNDVAVHFFLNKMRPDKRTHQVKRLAESVFVCLNTHSAMFVLIAILQMGPQQVYEYARSHARHVIFTLLQWPLWLIFYDLTLHASRHLSAQHLLSMLDPHQHLSLEKYDKNYANNYQLVQFRNLFESVWKDTAHEKKLEVIGLMIDYDTSCDVRPLESLNVTLKNSRWVFDRVFVNSNALFDFLLSGFRQNSTGLREVIFKYFPSFKNVEDVEIMLDIYESQTFEGSSFLLTTNQGRRTWLERL